MQNEHESTDIIRIEHLNKTFGDVKAVRSRKKHDDLHSLRTVIQGQRNSTDQRNR